MSDKFHVRLATPADADIIGTHRARMFHDMGDIPDHLFDEFRTKSLLATAARSSANGEYVGWLASPADSSGKIVGGAGVQLRRAMPHPLTVRQAKWKSPKAATLLFSMSSPNRQWRRRGVAALLMQHIIDWSRQKSDSIVSSSMPRMRAALFTKSSGSF